LTPHSFQSFILRSIQQAMPHRIMSIMLRPAMSACMWTLLTGVAEAGEISHDFLGGELIHSLGLHLNLVMTALWVFVLGSCIGSFLNVVIYRMPAGMALSHPGSRCPICETELTARDNIPILGWLTLKGRCRYCRAPISSRYPLIELTVGLLFLTLLLVETNSGAANLPLRESTQVHRRGIEFAFQPDHRELLGWFIAHVFFLTITLAVCMIGFDGHAPPRRLVFAGTFVGLISGMFWPEIRPVHAVVPLPDMFDRFWGMTWKLPRAIGGGTLTTGIGLAGILDGIAGACSGLLTGWLAAQSMGRHDSTAVTTSSVLLLAGVWCGWQMTWPLLAIVLIATAALRLFGPSRLTTLLPLVLFGSCGALIFCWNRLLNGVLLIRYDGWQWTSTAAWLDWMVSIGILAAVALMLSRSQIAQTSGDPDTPLV